MDDSHDPEWDVRTTPPRSMTERIMVHGGIAVAIVLTLIEGWSYFRISNAQKLLIAELKRTESVDFKVRKRRVTEILGGREPDASVVAKAAAGEERYDLNYFCLLTRICG